MWNPSGVQAGKHWAPGPFAGEGRAAAAAGSLEDFAKSHWKPAAAAEGQRRQPAHWWWWWWGVSRLTGSRKQPASTGRFRIHRRGGGGHRRPREGSSRLGQGHGPAAQRHLFGSSPNDGYGHGGPHRTTAPYAAAEAANSIRWPASSFACRWSLPATLLSADGLQWMKL